MSTVSVALQTRTFRSLRRHYNYRLFFGGQIVSLAGSWMQNVALAWLVLSLSRSPLAVAMLLFCRFAPYTLFGLFAGSIVDRVDTVVLGCTHYPMLAAVIQRILGPEVTLVDSAEATALTVEATLAALGLAEPEGGAIPEDHFCVTDAGERFARIAGRFLGSDELSLEWVEV